MRKFISLIVLFSACFLIACTPENNEDSNPKPFIFLKYLALGDSYTIVQSVCETCRFPVQLQDSIKKELLAYSELSIKIVPSYGLHSSELAYTKFGERILPKAKAALMD